MGGRRRKEGLDTRDEVCLRLLRNKLCQLDGQVGEDESDYARKEGLAAFSELVTAAYAAPHARRVYDYLLGLAHGALDGQPGRSDVVSVLRAHLLYGVRVGVPSS